MKLFILFLVVASGFVLPDVSYALSDKGVCTIKEDYLGDGLNGYFTLYLNDQMVKRWRYGLKDDSRQAVLPRIQADVKKLEIAGVCVDLGSREN